MDTGKKLWKVRVSLLSVSFNIVAASGSRAAEDGLACAKEILFTEGRRYPAYSLYVTEVKYEGTLDKARGRRAWRR